MQARQSDRGRSRRPKHQHFIPRMLLKSFCDDSGQLFYGDSKTRHVRHVSTRDAFVKKEMYTRYSYEGKDPDASYESQFSLIERAVEPIFGSIIFAVRSETTPNLRPSDILSVKKFCFSLARRTPESQSRVAAVSRDDAFFQASQSLPDYGANVGMPDKESLLAIEGMAGLAKKVLHNVDADFAAGDDMDLSAQEAKFCAAAEIHFVFLATTELEFVIGSHGLTFCDPHHTDIRAPRFDGSVLPIAPDVLIHICQPGNQDSLTILRARARENVEVINKATLSLSRFVAGRSERVVTELINR